MSWRRSALKVCLGSCVLKSHPGSPPASTPQSGHCFSRFPFPPHGSFPLPIKSFYNWSSFSRQAGGIACTRSQWALEKFASCTFFSEVLWKLSSASLSNSCIPWTHCLPAVRLLCSVVASLPWVFSFLLSSEDQHPCAVSAAVFFCVWVCREKGATKRAALGLEWGEVSLIFHQTHEPQITPSPQRLLQVGALASWACESCFLPFCLWVTWKLFLKLYSMSPTWEWVPFQEGICKSNLFISSMKLAYVPN